MTATFKVGDRVVITQKKEVSGIGWNREMTNTIGKEGVVLSDYSDPYRGSGGTLGYLVKLSESGIEWTYPTECLRSIEENYTFDSFSVDDEVLVLKKPEDQETLMDAGWVDGQMDDLIGCVGVVIDTHEGDTTILVYFEDTGAQWWFPYEALSKNLSATQRPDECLDLWFLGRYSGLPYKAISPDGPAYIVENELGEQFSSKYMRLDCAPKECKSFSYRIKEINNG